MKKILFALSAALMLFVACDNNEEGKKMSFVLTQDNIEVADLTDYLVVVDAAAKTVAIEIPYADKESLAALGVNFVGVPSTVTVENFTFDFSTGATKEVVFTEGELTATYVFSATAAAPQPKLQNVVLKTAAVSGEGEDQTVTYGPECPVAAGVARMKGLDNLKSVAMSFTVSPVGTKVYTMVVNEETAQEEEVEVTDGNILDFSDKVNGRVFTLKCDGVEVETNVKVATSGFSKLTKVWGHYAKDNDWFGTGAILATDNGKWDRGAAMDDKYVYMVIANNQGTATGEGANPRDSRSAYVLKIEDGSYVKTLPYVDAEGNVVITGGTHVCSYVQVMDNPATQNSVILISSLALNNGALKIYAYDSIDSYPRVVLNWTTNGRFGDFFSVEGDWSDGKIWFTSSDTQTAVAFNVKNGVVSQTPDITFSLGTGMSYGSIYKFSDSEYIWGGLSVAAQGYTLANGTYTQSRAFNSQLIPFLNITFFEFNDQKYMAGIQQQQSFTGSTVRIEEFNANTLDEFLANYQLTNEPAKNLFFGLVDPDNMTAFDNARKTNNLNSSLSIRTIGEDTYILGQVQNQGVALYKIER